MTSRFVLDSVISQLQIGYKVTWRLSYMTKITAANVKNVVLSISRLTKEVKVAEEAHEDGLPVPVRKENTFACAARFFCLIKLL